MSEQKTRTLDRVDKLSPPERHELLRSLQPQLLDLWIACDTVLSREEETLGQWHRRIIFALKELDKNAQIEIKGDEAA